MSYFDQNCKTELIVDASAVGLGAMLSQSSSTNGKEKQNIVAYASCTLDDVQSRYSQT